ncbi:MAG: maleylpyruvate isomerase family mycothiol-dependent enzyme [Chloroflexota bacterium]
MTNADSTIAALRSGHDGLFALVPGLDEEALAGPSGAANWDISQVLSHLGSGAEITHATVRAALDGQANPGGEFNQSVWARWNAMSRHERADGFIRANERLTELYESMDADTRETLRIDMGFLPAPADVATAAGLRLNELALHSWDVRVALDENATLDPSAAAALLPVPPMLIAWISKPEQLGDHHGVLRVTTTGPESTFSLRLADQVSIDTNTTAQPDGTLTLPAEAWLRLASGRLAPRHTPSGTVTTGSANLDLLRQVFPGF